MKSFKIRQNTIRNKGDIRTITLSLTHTHTRAHVYVFSPLSFFFIIKFWILCAKFFSILWKAAVFISQNKLIKKLLRSPMEGSQKKKEKMKKIDIAFKTWTTPKTNNTTNKRKDFKSVLRRRTLSQNHTELQQTQSIGILLLLVCYQITNDSFLTKKKETSSTIKSQKIAKLEHRKKRKNEIQARRSPFLLKYFAERSSGDEEIEKFSYSIVKKSINILHNNFLLLFWYRLNFSITPYQFEPDTEFVQFSSVFLLCPFLSVFIKLFHFNKA